jgi:Family of unknown function (DUF6152)
VSGHPPAAFALSGVLIAAGPALAHHPFASEFDANAPLSLIGKVIKVDWSDPHVMVHVSSDAQPQRHNCHTVPPSVLKLSF